MLTIYVSIFLLGNATLRPPKRGGSKPVGYHFPRFPLYQSMPSCLGHWSAFVYENCGELRKMINRRFTNPPFLVLPTKGYFKVERGMGITRVGPRLATPAAAREGRQHKGERDGRAGQGTGRKTQGWEGGACAPFCIPPGR